MSETSTQKDIEALSLRIRELEDMLDLHGKPTKIQNELKESDVGSCLKYCMPGRTCFAHFVSSMGTILYTAEWGGPSHAVESLSLNFVHKNVKSILGFDSSFFTGDPNFWRERIHPEDRANWQRNLSQLFPNRKIVSEYRFRHENGMDRWLRDEARLLRVSSGQPYQLVGSWIDISDYKHAEESLRQKEAKYRQLAENIGDVIWATDATGKFTFISPSLFRLGGIHPKDALEQSLDEIFPPASLAQIRGKWVGTSGEIQSGKRPGPVRIEVEWLRLDGSRIPIEIVATPLMTNDGVLTGFMGVTRDITERNRAEEVLLRSSRLEATSTLAAGVAHDLNNLMAGVMGYSELLLEDLAARLESTHYNEAAGMLSSITDSAQKAGQLAQKMLAFAQGGKYHPGVTNLNEVVQGVVNTQESTIPSSIRLRFDPAPQLWPIKADAAQLGEILVNLIVNSVEAIQAPGEIIISTSNQFLNSSLIPSLAAGKYVYLRMEDNGCGMSSEVQSRIFEPFFTTKFLGRGMGLAAVYGIIENHGGKITVRSEEGIGTVFEVYLPALPAQDFADSSGNEVFREDFSSALAPNGILPAAAPTILVVDDDDHIQDFTGKYLKKAGFQLLKARNGREAVEIARKSDVKIDLVLLDISMPDMGGTETFPLLKKIRPCLKIILISGYEMDTKVQALLHAGADSFLSKPFSLSALESEIKKAIGQRH